MQVVNLARGLNPDRFEQRLLVGAVEAGEADYLALRAPDVEPVRVPGLGRSIRTGGDARAVAAIMREMRAFRPDIVHTHTAKAGVLGRTAARALAVPHVVHTFHGHLLHGYFPPMATALVRSVERRLARHTDVLVAVGAQVRDDLLAAGIGRASQYRVVPPGVVLPEAPDPDVARAELGLETGDRVVTFIGRLTDIKRPDRLLAVARQVLRSRPDTRFLVVGEGPLMEGLRESAADLGGCVRFLGWRADVERIYAASDLALLTSDNEGMPVSLIEAGLCGVPAVTTAVGSAGEVVLHERSGLVVESTVEGLADAVTRLLDDEPLRKAMAARAAEHTHAAFGAERLVADMAQIYEALAIRGTGSAH